MSIVSAPSVMEQDRSIPSNTSGATSIVSAVSDWKLQLSSANKLKQIAKFFPFILLLQYATSQSHNHLDTSSRVTSIFARIFEIWNYVYLMTQISKKYRRNAIRESDSALRGPTVGPLYLWRRKDKMRMGVLQLWRRTLSPLSRIRRIQLIHGRSKPIGCSEHTERCVTAAFHSARLKERWGGACLFLCPNPLKFPMGKFKKNFLNSCSLKLGCFFSATPKSLSNSPRRISIEDKTT